MSLYNMLHGENQFSSVLLAMLGINRNDVPRYRDCWWDGEYIAIHTRTGGGNRDHYEEKNKDNPDGPWNSDLYALPTFVRDEDDNFDSTYATFYFLVPEKLQWAIPHLQKQESSPAEKWKTFMEKMDDPTQKDDPQVARALAAFAPLFVQIQEHLSAEKSN